MIQCHLIGVCLQKMRLICTVVKLAMTQKNKQTDRQTDRQNDGQTDRKIDRKTERQTDSNLYIYIYI